MGADLIAMVEERLGVNFVKRPSGDWNKHLASLQSGECAIAPTIVSTTEREHYAYFTTPYANVPVVIITTHAFPKGLTLDDLEGHRVGLVSGYATEKYLQDHFKDRLKLVSVQNVAEGRRAVSFGQIDAFVENLAVAAHYIGLDGIPNLQVAGTTDLVFSWSIGISRKYPLLYSSIQKGIGTTVKIHLPRCLEKYMEVDSHKKPDLPHGRGETVLLVEDEQSSG